MNIETLITVVTYNSEGFILDCLNSIIDSHYKRWFLVVIDNNSQDKTTEKIERLVSSSAQLGPGNFELVKLGRNTGFAAAVDYSVFGFLPGKKFDRAADIKYLVLINPDLIIEKNSLDLLMEVISSGKDHIGAAGGLIFNYEKKEIQNAGGKIAENFITSHLTRAEEEKYEVDYVSGALFITDLYLFKKIRGFDRCYSPVYFEELDYCLKLRKLGKTSVISRNAVARHFEGASITKFSRDFYKYYHRNRIRCAVLNTSFSQFFRSFIPAEIRWLKKDATGDQVQAILLSYLLNFLFLPYNLIIKLKILILIRNYRNK